MSFLLHRRCCSNQQEVGCHRCFERRGIANVSTTSPSLPLLSLVPLSLSSCLFVSWRSKFFLPPHSCHSSFFIDFSPPLDYWPFVLFSLLFSLFVFLSAVCWFNNTRPRLLLASLRASIPPRSALRSVCVPQVPNAVSARWSSLTLTTSCLLTPLRYVWVCAKGRERGEERRGKEEQGEEGRRGKRDREIRSQFSLLTFFPFLFVSRAVVDWDSVGCCLRLAANS